MHQPITSALFRLVREFPPARANILYGLYLRMIQHTSRSFL